MIITSLIWSSIIFVPAAAWSIFFYFAGRFDEKKKEKIVRVILPACVLLIILYVVILLILYYGTSWGFSKQEMRRRLNQPVVSKEQLYGYKIVGKKIFRYESSDGSSSPLCLINIEDLLGDKYTILENVEVSQGFFNKLELEERFLPKPVDADPNFPAAEH